MRNKHPMVLIAESYANLVNNIAILSEQLVEDLVLDKDAREEVISEYYTQENINTYWINKRSAKALIKAPLSSHTSAKHEAEMEAEEESFSYLDNSILPDNFWKE